MEGSASFRINIDNSTNAWNLQNINLNEFIDTEKSINRVFNYNLNCSINSAFLRVPQEPDKFFMSNSLRLNKRRSSSASYLNEEDDYDNDLTKIDYMKKIRRQLSLEELENTKSQSSFNKNLLDPYNLNHNKLGFNNKSLDDPRREHEFDTSDENLAGEMSSSDQESVENLFSIEESDEKLQNIDCNKGETNSMWN